MGKKCALTFPVIDDTGSLLYLSRIVGHFILDRLSHKAWPRYVRKWVVPCSGMWCHAASWNESTYRKTLTFAYSVLQFKAAGSSETLVHFYKTVRPIIFSRRQKNLTYHIHFLPLLILEAWNPSREYTTNSYKTEPVFNVIKFLSENIVGFVEWPLKINMGLSIMYGNCSAYERK
jgi:hypothetical protein